MKNELGIKVGAPVCTAGASGVLLAFLGAFGKVQNEGKRGCKEPGIRGFSSGSGLGAEGVAGRRGAGGSLGVENSGGCASRGSKPEQVGRLPLSVAVGMLGLAEPLGEGLKGR
jgi:hypothetical protein